MTQQNSEVEQVSSVKTVDQYKRIYVPDKILEAMGLEVGDNLVWMNDKISGEYFIRKATVTIE
jgi:bifunctional DNA-binding transcriptional regulator/antitoxin component of YhaV-PrlF toxin-antitoxin module